MAVTDATSHELMFWLKRVAPPNISTMLMAELVSQLLSALLKELAKVKV